MNAPLQEMYQKGATSKSVVVRIVQLSVAIGGDTPAVSMDETTSGLVLRYRREGEIATSIAPAALSFLTSSWTAGGFEAIGDGHYRVDVPDAAWAKAAGVNNVLITGAVTGGRVEGCMIQLVDGARSPNAATPEVY